mmetsp:Transcript_2521/g.9748  ORF Transcript_2521/g.9748 Transcript_2521/m.9748 type:complete len:284 (-) Transcript_2521:36-887(-)
MQQGMEIRVDVACDDGISGSRVLGYVVEFQGCLARDVGGGVPGQHGPEDGNESGHELLDLVRLPRNSDAHLSLLACHSFTFVQSCQYHRDWHDQTVDRVHVVGVVVRALLQGHAPCSVREEHPVVRRCVRVVVAAGGGHKIDVLAANALQVEGALRHRPHAQSRHLALQGVLTGRQSAVIVVLRAAHPILLLSVVDDSADDVAIVGPPAGAAGVAQRHDALREGVRGLLVERDVATECAPNLLVASVEPMRGHCQGIRDEHAPERSGHSVCECQRPYGRGHHG